MTRESALDIIQRRLFNGLCMALVLSTPALSFFFKTDEDEDGGSGMSDLLPDGRQLLQGYGSCSYCSSCSSTSCSGCTWNQYGNLDQVSQAAYCKGLGSKHSNTHTRSGLQLPEQYLLVLVHCRFMQWLLQGLMLGVHGKSVHSAWSNGAVHGSMG